MKNKLVCIYERKYNMLSIIITALITFLLTVVTMLGIFYGFSLMPSNSRFSFETLGVYLGSAFSGVAIIALWISTKRQLKKQAIIQNENNRLSLFDKRIRFYYQIKNDLNFFIGAGNEIGFDMFHKMDELKMEAEFLFGDDVVQFIENIAEKMRQYLVIYIDASKEGHPPRNEDEISESDAKKMGDIYLDFNEMESENSIYKTFEKYLKINEYGVKE